MINGVVMTVRRGRWGAWGENRTTIARYLLIRSIIVTNDVFFLYLMSLLVLNRGKEIP